jgi:hypothetical protein
LFRSAAGTRNWTILCWQQTRSYWSLLFTSQHITNKSYGRRRSRPNSTSLAPHTAGLRNGNCNGTALTLTDLPSCFRALTLSHLRTVEGGGQLSVDGCLEFEPTIVRLCRLKTYCDLRGSRLTPKKTLRGRDR